MIKHNFFQLLINLFLFSEDHISFPLNRCWLKFRVLEDIGEDVDGLGNVGIKGLRIVDSIFSLE